MRGKGREREREERERERERGRLPKAFLPPRPIWEIEKGPRAQLAERRERESERESRRRKGTLPL